MFKVIPCYLSSINYWWTKFLFLISIFKKTFAILKPSYQFQRAFVVGVLYNGPLWCHLPDISALIQHPYFVSGFKYLRLQNRIQQSDNRLQAYKEKGFTERSLSSLSPTGSHLAFDKPVSLKVRLIWQGTQVSSPQKQSWGPPTKSKKSMFGSWFFCQFNPVKTITKTVWKLPC